MTTTMNPIHVDRRTTLSLLAAAPLALNAPAVQAAVPTDRITVLYRKESPTAPNRLDPAVQFATLALEAEMIQRGFRVIQPSAQLYQVMDQGQAVLVTFAPDAGFSLVFSAYRDLRPAPGQEAGTAEVRLQARVYVGRNVLVAEDARGQMFTRLEPAVREFGERRAMELAAKKAAAELADKVATRLKSLSAQQINDMVDAAATSGLVVETIGLPAAPPAPVVAAPAPAPAPAAAAPAPVAAPPVAAPAPAPVVAAAPPRPAEPLPAPRNRYALVVGMSNYASVRNAGVSGVSDLPGVARDTTYVVDSLRKLGFADDRMLVLRDAQATGNRIRSAMKLFAGTIGPDDLLLIFISAHGADKEASYSGFGMPVLADFSPKRDNGELDFWELQSMAKNLRGRVVWINDTCHSGGAATGVASVVVGANGVSSAGEVRGPDAATVARSGAPGQDFAILTASSPHEISWETGEGGLFTTRLFGALRGSGGQVALGKLFADGVQREVIDTSKQICQRAKACAQHPQQTPIFAYGGSGHLIRL